MVDFGNFCLRSSWSILAVLLCIRRQHAGQRRRSRIWCIGSTFAILRSSGGGGGEDLLIRSIVREIVFSGWWFPD
jgi:hypothetical protein